jgi:hypothetical protein
MTGIRLFYGALSTDKYKYHACYLVKHKNNLTFTLFQLLNSYSIEGKGGCEL